MARPALYGVVAGTLAAGVLVLPATSGFDYTARGPFYGVEAFALLATMAGALLAVGVTMRLPGFEKLLGLFGVVPLGIATSMLAYARSYNAGELTLHHAFNALTYAWVGAFFGGVFGVTLLVPVLVAAIVEVERPRFAQDLMAGVWGLWLGVIGLYGQAGGDESHAFFFDTRKVLALSTVALVVAGLLVAVALFGAIVRLRLGRAADARAVPGLTCAP